jgi:hypothetical protein
MSGSMFGAGRVGLRHKERLSGFKCASSLQIVVLDLETQKKGNTTMSPLYLSTVSRGS